MDTLWLYGGLDHLRHTRHGKGGYDRFWEGLSRAIAMFPST